MSICGSNLADFSRFVYREYIFLFLLVSPIRFDIEMLTRNGSEWGRRRQMERQMLRALTVSSPSAYSINIGMFSFLTVFHFSGGRWIDSSDESL